MPSSKGKQSNGDLLLAGDIGATNTRLAIYAIHGDLRTPMRAASFMGNEYAGLVEILQEFLPTGGEAVQAACFGVAGPVVEGRVRLTNLPWVVDAAELMDKYGWQGVWLLNDLQAIANSVPLLGGHELQTLKAGVQEPQGNVALAISPGRAAAIMHTLPKGGMQTLRLPTSCKTNYSVSCGAPSPKWPLSSSARGWAYLMSMGF